MNEEPGTTSWADEVEEEPQQSSWAGWSQPESKPVEDNTSAWPKAGEDDYPELGTAPPPKSQNNSGNSGYNNRNDQDDRNYSNNNRYGDNNRNYNDNNRGYNDNNRGYNDNNRSYNDNRNYNDNNRGYNDRGYNRNNDNNRGYNDNRNYNNDNNRGFNDNRSYNDDRNNRGFNNRGPPRDRRERTPVPFPTEPPYTAYIGNLPYDADEIDVKEFFTYYSELDDSAKPINLIHDKIRLMKGYGYIEVEDPESLTNAMDLTGLDFRGRIIKIDVAERQTDRTKGSWLRNDRPESEPARERPKLELKPRTIPLENSTPSTSNSSGSSNPFGDAKPRDELEIQKKKEDERKQRQDAEREKRNQERAEREAASSSSQKQTSPQKDSDLNNNWRQKNDSAPTKAGRGGWDNTRNHKNNDRGAPKRFENNDRGRNSNNEQPRTQDRTSAPRQSRPVVKQETKKEENRNENRWQVLADSS